MADSLNQYEELEILTYPYRMRVKIQRSYIRLCAYDFIMDVLLVICLPISVRLNFSTVSTIRHGSYGKTNALLLCLELNYQWKQ